MVQLVVEVQRVVKRMMDLDLRRWYVLRHQPRGLLLSRTHGISVEPWRPGLLDGQLTADGWWFLGHGESMLQR